VVTIKQLETFYWVGKLGTVHRAAAKLCVTQSAATKRLQELEALSELPLFESEKTKAKLSAKGKELMTHCTELIAELEKLKLRQTMEAQNARVLHIGVTELVATMWFPRFVAELSRHHPDVVVQPELMHSSGGLKQRVVGGELDLAFVPDHEIPEVLTKVPLNAVTFSWYCARGTSVPAGNITLQELAAFPIIEQDEDSVSRERCRRLFNEAGTAPIWKHGSNSVYAMAALVEAGAGVGCLPDDLFSSRVVAGRLQRLSTRPKAPTLRYCATYLKRPDAGVEYAVALIARETCTRELTDW
jgi:DNA-binding transcriptional LysR family regulator